MLTVGSWLLVVGKTGWMRNADYLRIPVNLKTSSYLEMSWLLALNAQIVNSNDRQCCRSYIAVRMRQALKSHLEVMLIQTANSEYLHEAAPIRVKQTNSPLVGIIPVHICGHTVSKGSIRVLARWIHQLSDPVAVVYTGLPNQELCVLHSLIRNQQMIIHPRVKSTELIQKSM